MGTSAVIDFRTRFDGATPTIAPVEFFDEELPRRLAGATELLASTDGLDLRPLVVRVGDAAWRLERTGGRVQVGRWDGDAGAEVRLEPDWLSDLVVDQTTPIGLMTSGRLDLRGAGIGRLLDWWLVLRCVLDGRPVHTPGSLDLPDRLDRSFSLDDDPADMFAFLASAGFLHVRGVFTEAEMAAVSADMDVAASGYSPGDGHSWWATMADGSDRLVRMQHFEERSAATAALMADGRLPRIAAVVDEGYAFRRPGDNRIEALFKPIGVREGISDVPWHKDCSLGRHSYECCRLTVGVSVTGAGPGTGQLRVVAGSHRALVWPSLLEVSTTGLPVVPLATETGDVTVHLSCTLHMAEPPTDAERRVLYTDFVLPARDPEAAEEWRRRLVELREQAPLNTSQPPAPA
ncbi:MAG: hypothetical protein JWM47_2724 [Acidimicrobiales bacterium]|nr:hypothetical protein [Acidimicrobiales bacterium]